MRGRRYTAPPLTSTCSVVCQSCLLYTSALYQMGEYNKAADIYDRLIDRGEIKAYSLKAYCLMQRNKTKEALEAVSYTHLDTLKYLKKGGRVTSAGAAIGTVLGIKPVPVSYTHLLR